MWDLNVDKAPTGMDFELDKLEASDVSERKKKSHRSRIQEEDQLELA